MFLLRYLEKSSDNISVMRKPLIEGENMIVKSMNKKLLLLAALCSTSVLSFADVAVETNAFDSLENQIKQTYTYPGIYPFRPTNPRTIWNNVTTVTQDPEFEKNFMELLPYSNGKAKEQPWTSSYWPLNKATIADPYENSFLGYAVDIGWVAWKNNYRSLKRRRNKIHVQIRDNFDSLSQKDLDKLAPSEKYDILIGDTSFDLTNRLVDYMYDWGSKKENAFITKVNLVGEDSLDLAMEYISNGYYTDVKDAFERSWNLKPTLAVKKSMELFKAGKYSSPADAFPEALKQAKKEGKNYVLEKKNSRMAAWEGICNGWATAAGLVPRPTKVVSFDLPNGKKLNFYPADIKGLVALYYVNSLIQDGAWVDPKTKLPTSEGVVSAGLRCNLKNPATDVWGRVYDHVKDPFSGKHESRCAGVHPATWHLGVMNLMGKQGRSFIVERKAHAPVDNAPLSHYNIKYFNPNEGETTRMFDPLRDDNKVTIEDMIVPADDKDQFKQIRHPATKYIVGVEMEIVTNNYTRPNRKTTNSPDDDKPQEKTVYYDLELAKDYTIIGGQWRAIKRGIPAEGEYLNHNQPDFFWTITKDYKKTGWFDDAKGLEEWKDTSKLPPKSWLPTAKNYHAFNYQHLIAWGNAASCRMYNEKRKEWVSVYCEMKVNRPQPLSNVVNKLVELSKEK